MKTLLILLALVSTSIFASEEDYTIEWCAANNGEWKRTDVRLPDGTFPDCVTATHIIEVDFAKGTKHYEGMGQALHYYYQNGAKLKPMVLLIVDSTVATEVKRYNDMKSVGDKICPKVEVRKIEK